MTKIKTPKAHYADYGLVKCVKPSLNRTYVRILARCVEPATMRQIYPGCKNIMPNQVYALESSGLLERYIPDEHLDRFNATGKITKSWWKTTLRGLEIVARAVQAG